MWNEQLKWNNQTPDDFPTRRNIWQYVFTWYWIWKHHGLFVPSWYNPFLFLLSKLFLLFHVIFQDSSSFIESICEILSLWSLINSLSLCVHPSLSHSFHSVHHHPSFSFHVLQLYPASRLRPNSSLFACLFLNPDLICNRDLYIKCFFLPLDITYIFIVFITFHPYRNATCRAKQGFHLLPSVFFCFFYPFFY